MTEQKLRILVVYCGLCNHVQTTFDYLKSFSQTANADIFYAHVTRQYDLTKPVKFLGDINEYDAVILHYSARLITKNHISTSFASQLISFRGVKVAIVQDEYEETNKFKRQVRDLGINIVVTCVPPSGIEYVYGDLQSSGVTFVHAMTGYVTDELRRPEMSIPRLEDRPVVVGYRARELPPTFGKLGRHKFEIGVRMQRACEERNLKCDISMQEKDRIYGTDWYDFLQNCRVALGTQSGSNVFDFDGSLAAIVNELSDLEAIAGSLSDEIHHQVLDRESKIDMGQMSPRIFEYAACRTVMVLLEGNYSGIVEPNIHYIPLKEDFSNIEEVFEQINDLHYLEQMVGRAYTDLIEGERYSYRSFVENLISEISILSKQTASKAYVLSDNLYRSSVYPVGESIDIWTFLPNRNIITLEHLFARQQIANYKDELWRMADVEGQIIDAYTDKCAELASRDSSCAFIARIEACVGRLNVMRFERKDIWSRLTRNNEIDDREVVSASNVIKSQVDELYSIYHEMLECLALVNG